MPQAQAPMPCPRCGYDLATVAGESGVCPECGREFSKPALAREAGALLSAALALTGLAAVGVLVGGAMGACVAYLPRAGPTAMPQVYEPVAAARALRAPAAVLCAAGIGALGFLTGLEGRERRWPVAVAVMLALSWVYALLAPGYADPAYSAWLQPQSLGRVPNEWVQGAAPGVLFVASGTLFLRMAGGGGRESLRRAGVLLIATGVCAAAFFLLSRWHSGYVYRTTGFRMQSSVFTGAPPAPAVPYYRSWVLNDAIVFGAGFLEYLGWAGLAATSLLTRAAQQGRAATG